MTITRRNYGKGHGYKIDGQKVTGVTTLISDGMPKPALPYWSAKCVAEYVADVDDDAMRALRSLGRAQMIELLKKVPWSQRDSAAVRGTAVHGLAEQLIHGAKIDVPDELAGHVDACVKFMDEWRVAPVLVEAVVGSRRWRYAGTLDLIADLPDGRRALMDYKTSASGIFPETALQLAAYRHAEVYLDADGAEQPMEALGVDCAYAVHLRADGYDVIPVNTEQPVFNLFLHVAYVARQREIMPAYIGDPEHWSTVVAPRERGAHRPERTVAA